MKDLGPVYLNGMTVKEANAYLQRELSKSLFRYRRGDPNSQIRLTLGDIRTIQIHIMGEVTVPVLIHFRPFPRFSMPCTVPVV